MLCSSPAPRKYPGGTDAVQGCGAVGTPEEVGWGLPGWRGVLRLVPLLLGLRGGTEPSTLSPPKGALILRDTVPGSAVANCSVPS